MVGIAVLAGGAASIYSVDVSDDDQRPSARLPMGAPSACLVSDGGEPMQILDVWCLVYGQWASVCPCVRCMYGRE